MLDNLVRSMDKVGGGVDTLSQDVQPFDSVELSPEEQELIYSHPVALFPNEVDETTGLPLTNAQAAHRLFQSMGPVEYVKWVEQMERRLNRA